MIIGPGANISNAALSKSFKVTERLSLRWEFTSTNTFNHPSLGESGSEHHDTGAGECDHRRRRRGQSESVPRGTGAAIGVVAFGELVEPGDHPALELPFQGPSALQRYSLPAKHGHRERSALVEHRSLKFGI